MISKTEANKVIENNIIRLLIEGKTLKQIADEMNFAKSTISYKLRQIFFKYNVTDRHEFVFEIYKNNIEKLKDEILRLKTENENLKNSINNMKGKQNVFY